MARAGTGSRFVSVNLNKSYGQPPGAGASGLLQGGPGRSRQAAGMVLLSRPLRPQPVSSASKAAKLSIPRPVNLPSLRKEHAGNDPTVSLVASSGASGWTKQLPPSRHVEVADTQPSLPADTAGRSDALSAESTWGTPVFPAAATTRHSTARIADQNGELRPQLSEAPIERPSVYTPPGARNVQANGAPFATQLPPPASVQKAVVLRGEDFPTLQASLPNAPAPSQQQRQKELHQRQRDKQQELKEQQWKLQQLSELQQAVTLGAPSREPSGPQLQPAQLMRPQVKPKQSSNLAKDDMPSVDSAEGAPNSTARKAKGFSLGPSPLVRLSHTSNWIDDERETLQNLRPQGIADWSERERPRSSSGNTAFLAPDGRDGYRRRPSSRNGSSASYVKDLENGEDSLLGRDDESGLQGGYGRDHDGNSGLFKGVQNGRVGSDRREGSGGRDSGFPRGGSSQGSLGLSKDRYFSKDLESGGHDRLAGVGRDSMRSRDKGFGRDAYTRTGSPAQVAGNGREGPSWDGGFRDGYSRDGGFEWKGGNLWKDGLYSRQGDVGDQDGSRGRQGDRSGRNKGYQHEGYGRAGSFVGGRGVKDSAVLDSGKDRGPSVSYGQPYREEPLFRGLAEFQGADFLSGSGFGMDLFGSNSSLDIKLIRRKKDEVKEDDFRDLERESFEAELERIQRIQEQERQRVVEEQEKAFELARQEQEERERLAREEELARLKLEEEAREAAARAERETLEAALKLEQERRAREDEKHRVAMEEERRKEAARRKLLELEERIAKRASEKKREEVAWQKEGDKENVGRLAREKDEARFREVPRKRDDVTWEEHFAPVCSVPEQDDDERGPIRLSQATASSSMVRRVSDELIVRGMRLETGSQGPDFRGGRAVPLDRPKILPAWREDGHHYGHGPDLSSTSILPQDDLYWRREPLQRGISPREPSDESPRKPGPVFAQDGGPEYPPARKDRDPYLQKQRWNPNKDEVLPEKFSHSSIHTRYFDGTSGKDVDQHWSRGHRPREGQRLPSPPLPSYLQSMDATDALSFSRLRQSLPKQPRVPLPPSRSLSQRLPRKAENDQSPFSDLVDADHRPAWQVDMNSREGVDLKEVEFGKVRAAEKLHDEPWSSSKQENSTLHEVLMQSDADSQESEHDFHGTLREVSMANFDKHAENVPSQKQREEADAEIAPRSAAVGSWVNSDSEIAKESIAPSLVKSFDDKDEEDDWVASGDHGVGNVEVEGNSQGEDRIDHGLDDQRMCTSVPLNDDDEDTNNGFTADDYEEVGTVEESQDAQYLDEVPSAEELEKPLELENEYVNEGEEEAKQVVEDFQEEVRESGQSSQETVQEPAAQLFLQHGSFLSFNSIDSMQSEQSEVFSSRQSLVQQFQQPFSFMAVPLPPSSTPSTASQQTSVPPTVSGFQSHREMPYHLQFGLLPGTPLLPNAIQIGSIQMPLHVHPQIPQFAHLHGRQPPLFQFGQIGHSAPISQPPVAQAAVPVCHPVEPSPHDQPQTSLEPEISVRTATPKVLAENGELPNQGERFLQSQVCPIWVGFTGAMDAPNHVETIEQVIRSGVKHDLQYEHRQSSEELGQHANSLFMEAARPKESCADGMVVDHHKGDEGSQCQPDGMLLAGTKGSDAWSTGILGQAHARHLGKASFEGQECASEITWSEMGVNGRLVHSSSLDRQPSDLSGTGSLQITQEAIEGLGFGHFNALGNSQSVTSRDDQRDLVTRSTVNGEAGQSSGAVTGSFPFQSGSKSDWPGSVKLPLNNTYAIVPNSSSMEGIAKKYGNQEPMADLPRHGSVIEQLGNATPIDEVDFIEVRSKRQMLNDKREQKVKEHKAKTKEIKSKEQAARKQQKLFAKDGQQGDVVGISLNKTVGSHGVEKGALSGPSIEAAINDKRHAQPVHGAGVYTNCSQACAAQPFSPIGTPARGLSDVHFDKRSKGTKPMQGSACYAGVGNDTEAVVTSLHESQSGFQESLSSTTVAWGGQGTTHQVVSLTQIQLEEAMKPLRFEGSLFQHLPKTEKDSRVFEPGVSAASGVAHERTYAAVSGPISSLFAGEKIQFGAVTAPTPISPSSRPLSPFVGAGSPLQSGPDESNDNVDLNGQARHFPGPVGNVTFNSKERRARGDGDGHIGMVDPEAEAEAEAAASAVAVAAISSDESVRSATHPSLRNISLGGMTGIVNTFENTHSTAGPLGVPMMRPVFIQAPMKEDSMTVALPADLSVETPSPMLPGPSPFGQGSTGLILPTGCPPPFPCLEMGSMLGRPIFAFGPHEEASHFSQGYKHGPPLEPGFAPLRPGGWQQQHSGGMDSFYGGPLSGFAAPFISPIGPVGGIPSIQGPPHMLVYTNPFPSVGHFSQLGMSFMGPAYLPAGKQPDWKHTPTSGGSCLSTGEMGASLSGMMSPQCSIGLPNPIQQMTTNGSSVMAVPPSPGRFDVNSPAPFQVLNADASKQQSQWSQFSRPPLHSVPISGSVAGLSLQPPRNSVSLSNQIGHLPHMLEASNGFHLVSVLESPTDFLPIDAAAEFPDELGLGEPASSNSSSPLAGGQRSFSRGQVSNSAAPVTFGPSGNKLARGRRSPRSMRGINIVPATSTGINSGDIAFGTSSNGQAGIGNCAGSSQFESQNVGQSGLSGYQLHSIGYADERAASQQGLARVSDWSVSHRRGAPGRPLMTERGFLGEKGFSSSSKSKQVYVAKSETSVRTLGTASSDRNVFRGQEVA